MRRYLFVVAVVLLVACGGQSKATREESARLGDQSGDVPPATLRERDWKKAAQGHGAAGPIPAEDLARMEKESAPGGKPSRDAGHGP
jgi:hypothetical protein